MPPPDLYAVLGVASDATDAEIARAYRRLVRRFHPDTRDGETAGAEGSDCALGQVIAAYAILRDPERRAGYDRRRTRERSTLPRLVVTRRPQARPQSSDQAPIRAGPVRWQGFPRGI